MDPRTVHARRHEVQLLDVREHHEVADGHIEDVLHIPMDTVPDRLDELPRDRPVVAVCRSGHRSGHVADYLNRSGFTARNMAGGVQQWVAEGLPLVKQRP